MAMLDLQLTVLSTYPHPSFNLTGITQHWLCETMLIGPTYKEGLILENPSLFTSVGLVVEVCRTTHMENSASEIS